MNSDLHREAQSLLEEIPEISVVIPSGTATEMKQQVRNILSEAEGAIFLPGHHDDAGILIGLDTGGNRVYFGSKDCNFSFKKPIYIKLAQCKTHKSALVDALLKGGAGVVVVNDMEQSALHGVENVKLFFELLSKNGGKVLNAEVNALDSSSSDVIKFRTRMTVMDTDVSSPEVAANLLKEN